MGAGTTRFPGVDGLRGLACLLVLLFHFGGDALRGTEGGVLVRALVSWGWTGVDLFFVLSGFLITDILLRTRGSPRYFRNFWGRRLLRIVPAYFVLLAMCLHVIPALWPSLATGALPERQVWLWTFSSNIWTWLHGGWGFRSMSLDFNHTWSLAIEEQFYLVWPFVVWLAGPRRLVPVVVIALAGCVGVRTALVLDNAPALFVYTFTPARVDGLLLGTLIAIWYRARGPSPLGQRRWIVLASVIPVVALFALRSTDLADPWLASIGYLAIAAASAGLLVAALRPNEFPWLSTALHARALVALGRYSYGTYLMHGVLRPWVEGVVERARTHSAYLTDWPAAAAMFSVIVGSVASIGLAVASYHLVERRLLRLKDVYFASA